MNFGPSRANSVDSLGLVEQVKQLLWHILSTARFSGVDILREQIAMIVAVHGPPTMIEIDLAPRAPRIDRPDGTLPVMPSITDTMGTAVGELLIWIADGRLATLEYAWWHDEEPTRLPQLGQLLAD